jgi:hypothetical protein
VRRIEKMKPFFGFAIADSMFGGDVTIVRKVLSVEEAKAEIAEGVVSALNPSHKPTIDAMQARFGINIEIPAKAPMVSLKNGDSLILMSVRGLPRLEGRHEYTEDEIAKATFAFSKYTVQ